MSKAILFFALLLFSCSGNTNEISYDDLKEKVQADSLYTQINSLEVFQSQMNVEKAKAQNKTKLNVFSLFKVVFSFFTEPLSIVESLGEIVPSLVPANRYRIKENERIYFSEKERYRVELANRILKSKAIYLSLVAAQNVKASTEEAVERLEKLRRFALAREATRHIPYGASKRIEILISNLKNDELTQLELSALADTDSLAQVLNVPVTQELMIAQIPLPDVSEYEPIVYQDFIARVLSESPELQQNSYLAEVIPFMHKEVKYSFIGTSDISRGRGGGPFEHISIEGGMGVGRKPTNEIIRAQMEILSAQRTLISEELTARLKQAVTRFNSYLERVREYQTSVADSVRLHDISMNNPQLLRKTDFEFLIDEIMRIREQETLLNVSLVDFLMTQETLNRLMFTADFDDIDSEYPNFLPSEEKPRDAVMSVAYRIGGAQNLMSESLNQLENQFSWEALNNANYYFEQANRFFIASTSDEKIIKKGLKKAAKKMGPENLCGATVIPRAEFERMNSICNTLSEFACANDISQYVQHVEGFVTTLLTLELNIDNTSCEGWVQF